jgi:hypothetical protein
MIVLSSPSCQWRTQNIGEWMAAMIESGFRGQFEAIQTFFFAFLLRKRGKRISRGGGGRLFAHCSIRHCFIRVKYVCICADEVLHMFIRLFFSQAFD